MVTKSAWGGWDALDVAPAAVRQTRMSVTSVGTQIARGFGCSTYFGVSGEQLEGLIHLPLFDASAEVQEVGWLPTVQVNDVASRHGQTGSIHWEERTFTWWCCQTIENLTNGKNKENKKYLWYIGPNFKIFYGLREHAPVCQDSLHQDMLSSFIKVCTEFTNNRGTLEFMANFSPWTPRMSGNKLSDRRTDVLSPFGVRITPHSLTRNKSKLDRRQVTVTLLTILGEENPSAQSVAASSFLCCCGKKNQQKQQHWSHLSRLEMEWKELPQKNPSGALSAKRWANT